MRRRWYMGAAVVVTAISIAMLAPAAVRGDFWAWLILALALAIPVGALAELAGHRRRGRVEAMDTVARWTLELALAVAVVVYVDALRIEAAAQDCEP